MPGTKKNGKNNSKKNGSKNGSKPTMKFIPDDLWIAPKANLKGDSDRAWNDRAATATGSRLLELADIALGLKKPVPFKKGRGAAATSEGATKSD